MAPTYPESQARMELRSKAVAANSVDFPELEPKRVRLDEVRGEARDLTVEQASLTARKQDVSKRLGELIREGNRLVAFLDACVRERYGNRAEKLVEFGLQPFRGRPRVVLVGPDGQRLKRKLSPTNEEPPAEPVTS